MIITIIITAAILVLIFFIYFGKGIFSCVKNKAVKVKNAIVSAWKILYPFLEKVWKILPSFLSQIKSIAINLAIILLVFVSIWLIGEWLFEKRGLSVAPFQDLRPTSDEKQGKEVAVSLIAKLHAISDTLHQLRDGMDVDNSPGLVNIGGGEGEDLIADIGTVEVADTKLSLQSVLVTLKRIHPLSSSDISIVGTLQVDPAGPSTRITARVQRGERVHSFQVDEPGSDEIAIQKALNQLAFLVYGEITIPSDQTPAFWDRLLHKSSQQNDLCKDPGFDHLIDALQAYDRYIENRGGADLLNAEADALSAGRAKNHSHMLFGLLNNIGLALIDLELYDEAEKVFRQAIETGAGKPNEVSLAEANLSDCLEHAGDIDDAMWHAKQAQQLDPESPFPLLMLGTVLSDQQKFADAKKDFEKGLGMLDQKHSQEIMKPPQIDDIRARFHNCFGTLYEQSRQYDLAVTEFNKSYDADQTFLDAKFAFVNLTEALIMEDHNEEAASRLSSAINIYPDEYEFYYFRGLNDAVSDTPEKWKDARHDWQIALEKFKRISQCDDVSEDIMRLLTGDGRQTDVTKLQDDISLCDPGDADDFRSQIKKLGKCHSAPPEILSSLLKSIKPQTGEKEPVKDP